MAATAFVLDEIARSEILEPGCIQGSDRRLPDIEHNINIMQIDSSIGFRGPIFGPMDLKDAAAVAKSYICDMYVADAPQNVRLEGFLYDDHLKVWSFTIGFTRADGGKTLLISKIVRVSEADKSVLTVRDP